MCLPHGISPLYTAYIVSHYWCCSTGAIQWPLCGSGCRAHWQCCILYTLLRCRLGTRGLSSTVAI